MSRTVAVVTNGARALVNFRGTLIASLAREGVRVHGLAPDFDAGSRAELSALGGEPVDITLARTGLGPLRAALDAARLRATLGTLRPDAVLCCFLKPAVLGTLAARAAGVPRRIAMIEGLGHAFADDARGWRGRALRAATWLPCRAALARADRTVFLNAEDAAVFAAARLVDPARIVGLGGTGVDLAHFAPAPPAAGPPVFLMMARLLRAKGVADFAAAAGIVKRARPDARFVLLGGTDPGPGALPRSAVAHWERERLIEWPGHVGDVRGAVARARAVVLPSWYREGVPRSLQEAAAMGRAVVTTDHVGCRDAVAAGVSGLLVPVRDPRALAAALLRLADDPGLAAAMGRAGRTLAERRFNAREKDARLRALLLG